MRLGNKEIALLITVLDGWHEGLTDMENRPFVKLCKKFSKELDKRGFTTCVSKKYLKEVKRWE